MNLRLPLPLFLVAGVLLAHPMGNFSVSHYSRIQVAGGGAELHYVLDLAEIPTFELLQAWKLDPTAPHADLEQKAAGQARIWVANLKIVAGGHSVIPKIERTSANLEKGAGGLMILRVMTDLKIAAAPGTLTFEDGNFPDRTGWKEIVIEAGRDASIDQAAPIGKDQSRELTAYPQDPLVSPPQDLRASVAWHAAAPMVSAAPVAAPPTVTKSDDAGGVIAPSAAPNVQPGQAAPGMVVRGDYLSRLMHQGQIGWGTILVGMLVAFGLGSIHALSPGHGKTIVAAYLVGARGTAKHAAFLGGMVTFTHTISVFFLGLVTLFLSRYILPETIYPVLGTVSGLSIVWIGGSLFYKRFRKAVDNGQGHSHGGKYHTHDIADGELTHDHGDGNVHSHVPEGEISLGSLMALGASGGLVPCPSALVLLLSSVALGRVGLGLVLLVAFSAGLASVLTGIGVTVVYAKHLLPSSENRARSAAFRFLPVASAGVITCAGLLMTAVALGLIRPIAGI